MRVSLLSVTTFSVLSSAVVTGSATADWQYTKWGMTLEQVVAASKGTATANSDRTLDAEGFKAKLVAPYQSEGFTFRAAFMFGPDNKLGVVQLGLQNGSCLKLIGALTNAYGPQQSKSRSSVLNLDRWWDQKHGNDVAYAEVGASCWIQCRPLSTPGKPGGL